MEIINKVKKIFLDYVDIKIKEYKKNKGENKQK